MAYTRRHSPLGGITSVASAAAAVVGDPCLPTVANLVLQLHESEQPKAAPGQPAPPAAPVKGIGLCYAVKPLRAVVWVKERPIRGAVLIGGVIGALFLAGYATGSRSR